MVKEKGASKLPKKRLRDELEKAMAKR